jgi:hypothetical protein
MIIRIYFMWLALLTCNISHAQTFDSWVQDQVSAALDKQHVGQNGKGVDRQKESPSTDPRSTSLVDQSSATDFFSVAMNLIPVTPGISSLLPVTPSSGSATGTTSAGSGTATATLYAILAGLNKKSPTDPMFYKAHVDARRVSFTLGTAVSKLETDNTTTPSTVAGVKALLINHRELYTKDNLKAIGDVQVKLSAATAADAVLKDKIQRLMFAALHPSDVHPDGTFDMSAFTAFLLTAFSEASFGNTVHALPAEALRRISDLIESAIDPYSALRMALQSTYDQISKGMQLSLAYTGNIRDAKGNNDHRAALIFDYGLSERINWTVNASGDYTDRKVAVDSKGGRLATSFQGDLTKSDSAWGRVPMRLAFSGEAKWLTKQKPQYTFEAKLSIPVTSGLDLPIAYRYANRIALINQKDSEVRLGLSIDISRLAQVLR